MRGAAAEGLGDIAESLSDKNERDVTARQQLEEVLKVLEELIGSQTCVSSSAELEARRRIKRAIDHLEALERASLIDRVWSWLQAVSFKDWKTWAVILPAGWLLILFAVFLVKPLWLLRWNEALKD